jgi:H+-transporting ATPase
MVNVPSTSGVGLSSVEALRRRTQFGPNSIEDEQEHPVRLAISKLWAPIPWMLEVAIVIQLGLGEYLEATVVFSLLLFNAALGFFQENRAQAILETLKKRLTLTASVCRDGTWSTLAAADLVPGDLITLSLGTVVPADVRLVAGTVLIDQSMVTGESISTDAKAGDETYAGSLIRRGQATAEVVTTGSRTRFGRGAELIRTAHVESTEQKAIFRVVRNLAFFNGGVTVLLILYAFLLHLPINQIVPLALVAVLASIPVALPSMFTLAGTVGARELARRGALPTRLSSLDEAAGVDILCADKTGTLTRNELAVSQSRPAPGFDEARLLALAALASSPAGADPVDAAFRQAAAGAPSAELTLVSFEPFDPVKKMSSAIATTSDGTKVTIVKGAYTVVADLSGPSTAIAESAQELAEAGFRVLAVAMGPADSLQMAGLVALSDPPRSDSLSLIQHLAQLGVRTVMVTGDAATTAGVIAKAVGISGAVSSVTALARQADIEHIGVFANVLPEDKFALVKTLQSRGHVVAMCGDGVNDAPALRQAQMGVAVFSATDVAKSAAGIILTEPGLGGVVAAIEVGRSTFQRILTYTLRSLTHKVVQVLFLLGGLIITGHAIITPILMVLMMITGDLLSMSSSTDHVIASSRPDVWRIGSLTIASVTLGLFDLTFCVGSILVGRFVWHLDPTALRTLAVITLVFSAQAVFYVVRERRRLWSSRPGLWLVLSSFVDVGLFSTLAITGTFMTSLAGTIVLSLAACAIGLALVLDSVKVVLFRRLAII